MSLWMQFSKTFGILWMAPIKCDKITSANYLTNWFIFMFYDLAFSTWLLHILRIFGTFSKDWRTRTKCIKNYFLKGWMGSWYFVSLIRIHLEASRKMQLLLLLLLLLLLSIRVSVSLSSTHVFCLFIVSNLRICENVDIIC